QSNRRFTEWSRRAPSDMDGKAGRPSKRERASQTPYKNECSTHGAGRRPSERATGAWLHHSRTRTVAAVSARRSLRQSKTAATDHAGNAEDIFHYHGDRLHQFATACRTRLREGAGRRNRALSSTQRRKSVLFNGRRSAWPEGPAIGG